MFRMFIVVVLVILLSYYFGDIDNQFKVMSGNIKSERVL
jgi:hypothetical protein